MPQTEESPAPVCRVLVPYSPKRWGNAEVRIESSGDNSGLLAVKDFSRSPFVIRHTFARFLLRRETGALRRLEKVQGVPGPPVIREKWQLKMPYLGGFNLREKQAAAYKFTPSFFEELESLVLEMHSCNIVHLDMRNARNVLVTDEGRPAVIDFQSAISTNLMPGFMKRLLFSIDLAAVYKHWHKFCPESLTRERKETFNKMASMRGLWVIKGYPLREFRRRLREKRPKSRRNRQKIDLD